MNQAQIMQIMGHYTLTASARYMHANTSDKQRVVLYSRKVVGWSLGRRLKSTLVCEALRMALWRRRPPKGQLIHHSDSENDVAGSFWWSDLLSVRRIRVSGAGRPRVA